MTSGAIPLLCSCPKKCKFGAAKIYHIEAKEGNFLVHYNCASPEIKAFIDAEEQRQAKEKKC